MGEGRVRTEDVLEVEGKQARWDPIWIRVRLCDTLKLGQSGG